MEHIGVLRPLRVGTHAVENCTQSELVHVIFAHGSTRPLEIQFAVVPEPPPEPEPEPETREQQLAHLSKRQLRQRAEKAGVAPGKLKKAQSGSTPKADLIRLVLAAEPEPEPVRSPTACCLARVRARERSLSVCRVVCPGAGAVSACCAAPIAIALDDLRLLRLVSALGAERKPSGGECDAAIRAGFRPSVSLPSST